MLRFTARYVDQGGGKRKGSLRYLYRNLACRYL
jgi:hypothetical protein